MQPDEANLRPPERSRALLGAPGAFLGRSWGILGRSLGAPVALLGAPGPSWALLGAPMALLRRPGAAPPLALDLVARPHGPWSLASVQASAGSA